MTMIIKTNIEEKDSKKMQIINKQRKWNRKNKMSISVLGNTTELHSGLPIP